MCDLSIIPEIEGAKDSKRCTFQRYGESKLSEEG